MMIIYDLHCYVSGATEFHGLNTGIHSLLVVPRALSLLQNSTGSVRCAQGVPTLLGLPYWTRQEPYIQLVWWLGGIKLVRPAKNRAFTRTAI